MTAFATKQQVIIEPDWTCKFYRFAGANGAIGVSVHLMERSQFVSAKNNTSAAIRASSNKAKLSTGRVDLAQRTYDLKVFGFGERFTMPGSWRKKLGAKMLTYSPIQ